MTVSASVEVKNKLGIHARPAMMLFELVQGFDAHVLLRNEDGIEADADSVIGLLMLDSAQGKQVEVQVEGPEEVEAWPPWWHYSPRASTRSERHLLCRHGPARASALKSLKSRQASRFLLAFSFISARNRS